MQSIRPSSRRRRAAAPHRGAGDEALARSRGVCRACGRQPAVDVQHWAIPYPPAHAAPADDLIALCAVCHRITTTLRRLTRAGGSRHELPAKLSETLAQRGRA